MFILGLFWFRGYELPIIPYESRVSFFWVVLLCLRNSRDFIKKRPVFLFGYTKIGKSTLINDLLEEEGDMSRPAKEETNDPEMRTENVEVYGVKLNDKKKDQISDEALFFDTEGWEFGKAEGKKEHLLDRCVNLAKEKNIQETILMHRLILVLVLDVNRRGDANNETFEGLVREVCKKAAGWTKGSKGSKPVLVPVLSKIDTLPKDGELLKNIEGIFNRALHNVSQTVEA